MRLKACSRFVFLLVASCSLMVASVVNGGFETGDLTSWTVQGTAIASTGEDYPPELAPFAGNFAVRITSGAIDVFDTEIDPELEPIPGLETLLGLSPGSLNTIADGAEPTVGSAISQTINVLAGQVLTFRWNYVSSESSPFNDYSFFGFVLDGGGQGVFRLSSADALPPFGDGDNVKVSGWQTGSYQFTQSGTYSIFFGSLDATDTVVFSDLWIDNVGLGDGTEIPEPSALLLSGFGLLGLLAARKRLQMASK